MGKGEGSTRPSKEFYAVGYVRAAAGEGKFADCDWLCGVDTGGGEPRLKFVQVEGGQRFVETMCN